MSEKIIVYTTVFGDTDGLKEPTNPGNAEFVVFTDRHLKSKHWKVVRVAPTAQPSRMCRVYKQNPDLTFGDHDVSIWVDAAFQLLWEPERIVESRPGDFWAFRHPKRSRISQEADAIVCAGKGKAHDVYAQLAYYQAQGWDTAIKPQTVLTNGGFLVRRTTEKVKAFNRLWHQEVQSRCLRDQMSLDYCAHLAGLPISHFPGTIYTSPMLRCIPYRNKPTNDF